MASSSNDADLPSMASRSNDADLLDLAFSSNDADLLDTVAGEKRMLDNKDEANTDSQPPSKRLQMEKKSTQIVDFNAVREAPVVVDFNAVKDGTATPVRPSSTGGGAAPLDRRAQEREQLEQAKTPAIRDELETIKTELERIAEQEKELQIKKNGLKEREKQIHVALENKVKERKAAAVNALEQAVSRARHCSGSDDKPALETSKVTIETCLSDLQKMPQTQQDLRLCSEATRQLRETEKALRKLKEKESAAEEAQMMLTDALEKANLQPSEEEEKLKDAKRSLSEALGKARKKDASVNHSELFNRCMAQESELDCMIKAKPVATKLSAALSAALETKELRELKEAIRRATNVPDIVAAKFHPPNLLDDARATVTSLEKAEQEARDLERREAANRAAELAAEKARQKSLEKAAKLKEAEERKKEQQEAKEAERRKAKEAKDAEQLQAKVYMARTELEKAMCIPRDLAASTLTSEELLEGVGKLNLITTLSKALAKAQRLEQGLISNDLILSANSQMEALKKRKEDLKKYEEQRKKKDTKGGQCLHEKLKQIMSSMLEEQVTDLDDDDEASLTAPATVNSTSTSLGPGKFLGYLSELKLKNFEYAEPQQATKSLKEVLQHEGVPNGDDQAVAAIRAEFERLGDDDAHAEYKLVLRYVLDEEAGSCKKKWQHGLILDCNPSGEVREDRSIVGEDGAAHGKRLVHFVEEINREQEHCLTTAEVAAIRLYTTAAYKLINEGLREGDDAAPRHPLPVTVQCLDSGLKKLREKQRRDPQANREVELWRGIRDTKVPLDFLRGGGTELAPMSTTPSLKTAVEYSQSDWPMLLRITSKNWGQRGADITSLSAFPTEQEMLFPPRSVLFPIYSGAGPSELEVSVGQGTPKKWHIYDVEIQILAADKA